jgi:hypothetical protein
VGFNDLVRAIPLWKKLCRLLFTLLTIFMAPVEGREHNVIANVIDKFRSTISISVMLLEEFSFEKVVLSFFNISIDSCNNRFSS